jgi:hypothetical protein
MTRSGVKLRVTSTGQEVCGQCGSTLIYGLKKSVTVTEMTFVKFMLDDFHEIHAWRFHEIHT